MTGRSRTSLVALCLTDLLAPAVALATCTDPAAVATTRASAEMACPCAGATSHGAYVRCVGDVARAAGDLSSECRRAVVACAARSTCGRPGFVARKILRGLALSGVYDAWPPAAPKNQSSAAGWKVRDGQWTPPSSTRSSTS
jgi:hypothetical protein